MLSSREEGRLEKRDLEIRDLEMVIFVVADLRCLWNWLGRSQSWDRAWGTAPSEKQAHRGNRGGALREAGRQSGYGTRRGKIFPEGGIYFTVSKATEVKKDKADIRLWNSQVDKTYWGLFWKLIDQGHMIRSHFPSTICAWSCITLLLSEPFWQSSTKQSLV